MKVSEQIDWEINKLIEIVNIKQLYCKKGGKILKESKTETCFQNTFQYNFN